MIQEWQPKIKIVNGVYLVESQRLAGVAYEVNLTGDPTCTCKAFLNRPGKCKHILAAERFEQEKYFINPTN